MSGGGLTARKGQILGQLRMRGKLASRNAERQFSIGEKHAKRGLPGLSEAGLIRFVHRPRPGYHELGGP